MKTIVATHAVNPIFPAALVAVLEKAIRMAEIIEVVNTGLLNQSDDLETAIITKKAVEGNPFAKFALEVKLGANKATEVSKKAVAKLYAPKLRKATKAHKSNKRAVKFTRAVTTLFTHSNQADVGRKPKDNRPGTVYNLVKAIAKVAKTFGCSYKEVFNLNAFDVCRGGDRKESVCVKQLFAAAKAAL